MRIPNDPLELSVLFKGLRVEELEVLDLGSGKLDSPLSIHMRELPFKRLTLVEKWIRSNRILMQLKDRHQLAAQETTILFENAWDVVMTEAKMIATSTAHGRFDVITMLDVVEHLEMDDAVSMLITAKLIARKRVLVWIPIGECPQGDLEGNPYQVHKSVWTQEMLEALGYQVRVYPQYHKHFDPHVSAAWAVWDREEMLGGVRGVSASAIYIDEAEAVPVHPGVTFIDKEFADMMLNDESIRATEEEAEELRKRYGIPKSSGSSGDGSEEYYENFGREA